MKALAFIAFFTMIAPFVAIHGRSESKSEAWTETVQSDAGVYTVSVEPEQKKVEVLRVDDGNPVAPHLRVKILRKNKRPLELRLQTLKHEEFPRYVGRFDQWQNSYVGLQLEISFDKKTWKKIGNIFKRTIR